MANRLDGKVAIITGAASGIGAESARVFAAEGAKVVLGDVNRDQLSQVVEEIETAGGTATAVAVDISDSVQVAVMVETAVSTYGRLDILYANAGIGAGGTVIEMSEAEFDRVLGVNLRGSFLCAKHAVPTIIQAGGGAILFTASELALVGAPGSAAYCASKAGLIGMARAMALDHAAEGIRVNCICPGAVDTPLLWGEHNTSREEYEASIVSRMPLGRVGKVNEIANAALFLVSDDASFVTGTALVVDGGWTTR